jgi:hypothetical protein
MFEKLVRFETSDDTTPGTAYYRGTYEQVKAAIFATAADLNLTVKSHNDTHKEFLLKHKNYEIMVTAVSVTILETAVDVVVFSPVLRPGKKFATQFFATMKKHANPK